MHGDTLILKYAIADVLQNKMQSKSKSKKKLSDLRQKYVEWIRQMDKITQSLCAAIPFDKLRPFYFKDSYFKEKLSPENLNSDRG